MDQDGVEDKGKRITRPQSEIEVRPSELKSQEEIENYFLNQMNHNKKQNFKPIHEPSIKWGGESPKKL